MENRIECEKKKLSDAKKFVRFPKIISFPKPKNQDQDLQIYTYVMQIYIYQIRESAMSFGERGERESIYQTRESAMSFGENPSKRERIDNAGGWSVHMVVSGPSDRTGWVVWAFQLDAPNLTCWAWPNITFVSHSS